MTRLDNRGVDVLPAPTLTPNRERRKSGRAFLLVAADNSKTTVYLHPFSCLPSTLAVKMAVARPIRMLGAASIVICLFLIFQLNKGPTPLIGRQGHRLFNGMKSDPLLERAWMLRPFLVLFCCVLRFLGWCDTDGILITATGEPDGPLWRANDNDYSPDSANSARADAALISLVRNEEVDELIPTIRDLERTWNSKFNYPWIFFNDVPFTEEFKRKTRAVTKAKIYYGMAYF